MTNIKMRIVSVDVATKSLAISIIKYNIDICSDIDSIFNKYRTNKSRLINVANASKNKNRIVSDIIIKQIFQKILIEFEIMLGNLIELLNNKIIIEYLEVTDLIPDKKLSDSNIIERTQKLYNYLQTFDKKLMLIQNDEQPIKFLIEYQMGPNDKSRVISSQLIYHFIKYCKHDQIYLVGPSLKNQIVVGIDNSGNYSNFIEKYKSNYTANKNHSKFNFLKILKLLKSEHLIKNIKKKNIDDIADSVLMSIVWIYKEYIL